VADGRVRRVVGAVIFKNLISSFSLSGRGMWWVVGKENPPRPPFFKGGNFYNANQIAPQWLIQYNKD
jgi:hypothetical protein